MPVISRGQWITGQRSHFGWLPPAARALPIAVAVLVTSLSTTCAAARDDPFGAVPPLTLDAAVALAFRQSPASERARREREAGLAAAEREAPRFAPTVSLVGAGLLNGPRITFPRGTDGETTVVPHTRLRAELTAETPVYHAGAAAAARRARAAARAADLGLEQAMSGLRRDVSHAYFALLTADAGLTVAREGLEQARAHRRLVDDLVQAGRATRLDQLQGDVEVEQAATAAADGADARELAAAALLRAMGVEGVQAFRRSGAREGAPESLSAQDRRRREAVMESAAVPPERPDARTPERPIAETLQVVPPAGEPGPPPEEAAALAAVERRPDVQAVAAQVEEAEAGAALARTQSSPAVNLALGYALQTPSAFVARSSWNAGLTLTLPLGVGPRTRADARAAEAHAAAARAGLEELRLGARLEVRQALNAVRSARRRRESAGRSVAAAQEALRISELRFQAGRATGLEVAAARASLNRLRLDELRALYDWYTGLADLAHATGQPVPATSSE